MEHRKREVRSHGSRRRQYKHSAPEIARKSEEKSSGTGGHGVNAVDSGGLNANGDIVGRAEKEVGVMKEDEGTGLNKGEKSRGE